MARVWGLDEIPASLKAAVSSSLRVYDEAVMLPQAHRSSESGAFKNTAMKLNSTESELSPGVFSPNWWSGVSVLQVPNEIAEPLLRDPRRRSTVLKKLVDMIPSEMANVEIQVGPTLDGDEQDRDESSWVAGFDSPGCCVGLYSAQQSRAPENNMEGAHRIHNTYFLVCKAGGGIAAQTFHSRLTAALANGHSLDECLKSGSSPGPRGLRRVSMAAQRNRARILEMAARAIGFTNVDTIGDNASPLKAPHRMAIVSLNVNTNVLRESSDGQGRASWYYSAGCVDATTSLGLIASSNVHEGFIIFTDSNGGYKINLRNQAYNTLPFSSVRIAKNRDVVMHAAECHKKAMGEEKNAHPDDEWIRDRFGWKSKEFGVDIEPTPLWGTYDSEGFITAWGRELGIANCRVMKLHPEIVSIAGVEPAKLRAASKFVQKT